MGIKFWVLVLIISVSVSCSGSPERPGEIEDPVVVDVPTHTFDELVYQAIHNLENTDYVWGGDGVEGADCSGAMYYIFKYAGSPFPRMTSRKMYTIFGIEPTVHWSEVDKWQFIWWTFEPNRPYGHVGLAEGDGSHFYQSGVHSGFSRKAFEKGGYWDEPYVGYGEK